MDAVQWVVREFGCLGTLDGKSAALDCWGPIAKQSPHVVLAVTEDGCFESGRSRFERGWRCRNSKRTAWAAG